MPIVSSRHRSALSVTGAVAAIVATCALFATIGADARWLATLGHVIVSRGRVPAGIPFASAPSGHWTNALVLAELAFNALVQAFGDRGLMLAQLIAVAVAMGVLAKDAFDGGSAPSATARALLVAALGALSSLVIVRVQLFSLALFPILCALLRAESRRPSRRIWLVVPLLALWSNLHGAALLGLAVVVAYALFLEFRRRPLVATGLVIAAPISLLATPALLGTVNYYHGLLTNVAAQRGAGMWGPLSLSQPFDVIMIVAAAVLAFSWHRRRPPLWEMVVTIALAALTVKADRDGVWLMFFLAPQAARAWRVATPAPTSTRSWGGLIATGTVAAIAVVCFAVGRGPVAGGADPQLVTRAIALAHSSPVLAINGIDEQVAAAGGRIWAGDPIDAFSHTAQSEYLDFVAGTPDGRRALVPSVTVVLVTHGSPAQKLMARTPAFVADGGTSSVNLYLRRTARES
jgi:hypothetical protein